MFYKLILIAASATVAHCALLGHIQYASDAINPQLAGVNYQQFVASGLFGNPLYGQQQQQVAFQQHPTYGQYATPVLQSNYIQSPAVGTSFVHHQQQQPYFGYRAAFIPQQTVQYQSPQLHSPGTFQKQKQPSFGLNGYVNSPVVTQYSTQHPASFGQVQSQPQRPLASAAVSQPQSVHSYQSLQVQPLQQTVTPNTTPKVAPAAAVATPPRITSVQHFPARPLPPNNNNLVMKSLKNAHHYPATVNSSPVQPNQRQQQQPQFQQNFIGGSSQGSNGAFRTSHSTVAAPQPNVVPLAPVGQQPQTLRSPAVFPTNTPPAAHPQPQVIQNTPYFTETVIPASNLRSPAGPSPSAVPAGSLSQNPINIPSSTLAAPHSQTPTSTGQQHVQVQQVPQVQLSPVAVAPQPKPQLQSQSQFQPQTQHTAKYSPSTAVSHAKFSGMGVHWEW